jgi:hypothetical protein
MSSTHITNDQARQRATRSAKPLSMSAPAESLAASGPISAPLANPTFARLQKKRDTGASRLAWIALPIGAVALIGVVYATSHGGSQSQQATVPPVTAPAASTVHPAMAPVIKQTAPVAHTAPPAAQVPAKSHAKHHVAARAQVKDVDPAQETRYARPTGASDTAVTPPAPAAATAPAQSVPAQSAPAQSVPAPAAQAPSADAPVNTPPAAAMTAPPASDNTAPQTQQAAPATVPAPAAPAASAPATAQ